jgi:hypothetical protein
MIGLQRSSGLTTINDRKIRHPSLNIRLINAFKQQENKKLNQQQIHPRIFHFIFTTNFRFFLFI